MPAWGRSQIKCLMPPSKPRHVTTSTQWADSAGLLTPSQLPLHHTNPPQAPSQFLGRAPLDLPTVRVGFVNPAIGYGLFAARDLAKDEFIFHEAPLMTARFNEVFAADKALMQSQVAAYRAALTSHHDVTAVAFPILAARFGVPPVSYASAAATLSSPAAMGQNLVPARSQQLAASTVTPEQYAAYTGALQPAPNTSSPEARAACLDFFKHYAFQLPPSVAGTTAAASTPTTNTSTNTTTSSTATTREACIYLLASLINHCCTPTNPTPTSTNSTNTNNALNVHGPNCTWRIGPSGLAHFVRPRHICVQARRAIRAGEQLTWDYGKREKGFACECEVCREGGLLGHLGGLGSSCGVL